jgi:hypothetical protein
VKLPLQSNTPTTNISNPQAGGQSGGYIAKSLLESGRFNITALTRPESTSELPPSIKVAKASNDDHAALVSALRGQDVLLITLSVTAPPDTEGKLIRAAAEARVPFVMPNDWGCDTDLDNVVKDVPGFAKVPKARQDVIAAGVSSFISLTSGFWYEWSLAIPPSFGFDFPSKTATFFDDGETRISVSTWPQVGRAVTALLSLPIKPDDDDDGNPKERHCLETFKNKIVYTNSFTLSQQDMFDSVLRVTGAQKSDWTIVKEPARERYASAAQALQEGDRMAYVRMMYTRIFFDDGVGDFEARRGVSNGLLGLPREDLDEATKRAVERAEADPWASSRLVRERLEQAEKGIAL